MKDKPSDPAAAAAMDRPVGSWLTGACGGGSRQDGSGDAPGVCAAVRGEVMKREASLPGRFAAVQELVDGKGYVGTTLNDPIEPVIQPIHSASRKLPGKSSLDFPPSRPKRDLFGMHSGYLRCSRSPSWSALSAARFLPSFV